MSDREDAWASALMGARVEKILTDLIAELREVPYKSREVLASQAERRLREVSGE